MSKLFIVVFLLTLSCHPKKEFIHPIHKNITQSVYASGNVISRDQYQAFTIISGIVDHIYVSEGDSIKIGDKILTIANESQKLNIENARLSAAYANDQANEGKLSEAKMNISLAKSKMLNDSILLERQKQLWAQNIGSKIELEQRTLAYEASKTTYFSSTEKYIELGRTLKLSALQSKNNLSLASKLETDYTLKSMINGVIYSLNISEGEIATPQKPVATLGKINDFILEMQVDEYDIVQIKIGLPVMVVLNSHQDKVFEAQVSKINPMMNLQSKTFLVEAEFVQQPEILYPNVSFEANIIINSKENAVLIPREYLWNDSLVTKSNGQDVVVKTGLKDYKMIEILSGLSLDDELIISDK